MLTVELPSSPLLCLPTQGSCEYSTLQVNQMDESSLALVIDKQMVTVSVFRRAAEPSARFATSEMNDCVQVDALIYSSGGFAITAAYSMMHR